MKTAIKKKPLTEKEVSDARDRLHALSAIVNEAREEELAIRQYFLERLYPADKEEGAATVTVGNIKLSITKNLRRTIDKAEFRAWRKENPDAYQALIARAAQVDEEADAAEAEAAAAEGADGSAAEPEPETPSE